jgi:excisionase family DNA binding protein
MELKSLTTKEVARLCRVSDATVKRWEDAGLLRSERTNGGHRRFRAEEVARFQREQGLGQKIYNGDESAVSAATRRRINTDRTECSLFHSLVAGCEEEAANILIGAHLRGVSLAEIFDDSVCPAMRRIGELWYNGDLTITQEHIATRVVCNAVYKLRNVLPVAKMNGTLAMCCAMEGDFHELPTHLAQTVFENEGWEVLNFGANTPLYSLADEVLQHSPEVICISATMISDVERLSRDYKTFTEQIGKLKIPIILGGRVFADEPIRRRFTADLYAGSFKEIIEFARKLTNKN